MSVETELDQALDALAMLAEWHRVARESGEIEISMHLFREFQTMTALASAGKYAEIVSHYETMALSFVPEDDDLPIDAKTLKQLIMRCS